MVKVLIITGYGVNCEAESEYAWKLVGAKPSLVHLNDLLKNPTQILNYDAMMFIGGFSYGDHMSSGHVFAQRIKINMKDVFLEYIKEGKLILGICNGFQVMTKIGILPGLENEYFKQKVSLIQNDCGFFQNFWVNSKINKKSPGFFTKHLDNIPLPIIHVEGKLFTLDDKIINDIEKLNCVAVRYANEDGSLATNFPNNPNGSINSIVDCVTQRKNFGMMPHPEAYLFPENHPTWDFDIKDKDLPKYGLGTLFFDNAVKYILD